MTRLFLALVLTFALGATDASAHCGKSHETASEQASNDGLAHCGSCAGDDHKDGGDAKADTCSCKAGKDGASTWCDHCKVGHHEGKKISCEGCYKKATGEAKGDCGSCSKSGDAAGSESSSSCGSKKTTEA